MGRLRAVLHWFNQDDRHKFWRLVLLSLLVLGSGLGLRDPWPPSEPELALMMRTLATGGEWLIPFSAGLPFSDHPPFAIWLGGALTSVTGSLRLGFLLPTLLAALGTLWLVYDLGRRLWGPRSGRLAAIVLLCTLQFSLQAHRAQVDVVFTFCVTLGLYGLLIWMLLDPRPRWLVWSGIGIGFGMLTKGAGYLAALALLPWLWARFQAWEDLPPRPRLRALWPLLVTLLGTVMAWALPALAFVSGADDQDLDVFRGELLVNLLGGADLLLGGPVRPVWYLPMQALWLWLPLSLLLPWLAPIWRQRMRDRDPRTAILLGYVLSIMLFFTLLPGRHGVQILPALPAMALLVGANLGGTWWRPGVQWACRITLLLIGAALLAGAVLALFRPGRFGLQLPPDTPPVLLYFMGGLGIVALGLSLLIGLRSRHQALALPIFIGVAWVLVGWILYPTLNTVRTPNALLRQAEEVVLQAKAQPQAFAMLDWRPQFALASEWPVEELQQPFNAAMICAEGQAGAILGPLDQLQSLAAEGALQSPSELGVRHRERWGVALCSAGGARGSMQTLSLE